MNKLYHVLLAFAIGFPVICQAQLQVKGLITNEEASSLPFATVLLLNSFDSSLVQGQVSDIDGHFIIDVKDSGNYFISVSSMGYKEVLTPIFHLSRNNSPLNAGRIITAEKIEELDEVVVEAEKPMFEQKIDRTVINVQSNISRAGGSALDVLQRSPGVVVDKMNNSVALSGKQGVRIMVNGKVSRLPMEAVVQMLDGMNAENIDKIELITTPPSKYEAEGDAGMINIVTKQSDQIGINGSVSAFVGYGRRGKYGGSFNMNKRTKRLNIFGDLSSRNDYGRQYWISSWSIPVNNEMIRTTSNNNRKVFTGVNSGSVGFDYDLTKNTSIGGVLSVFNRQWDMDAKADILRFADEVHGNTIWMNTLEENNWTQVLTNVNIKHQFEKGSSLSVDLDKIGYESANPTHYFQHFFDKQRSATGEAQMTSSKVTDINISTAAVDFSGRLSDKVTVEAGGKGSFTYLQNDIVVNTLEQDSWAVEETLTSYAEMIENIGAGYFSATIQATEKMDLQLGLRYEHTRTKLDTRTDQNVVDRNFGKWFPTIFLNNRINDHNSWVMSYSRRIARPSFFQLAPFVIFNDPNSFFSGNVSLLPSFTDAFKVEYRHKSVLLSLQYSHDKNAITLFQPRINEANKQVSTAQNLDYKDNVSVVLSFPVQLTSSWEMQFSSTGSMQTIKAIYLDQPVSLSILNFNFNLSQKIKVSKSITAEVTGFYQSPQPMGVWTFGRISTLDIGLEKKFVSSSLRVSYSDILAMNKWDFSAKIPSENLDTTHYVDFETTIVNITYSKTFGNNKLKSKKRGTTGSSEEQKRLQQ